jgi:hypothetical protein
MRLLFRDLDPSFPYNSFKIMRLIIYNVFGDTFQNYAPTETLRIEFKCILPKVPTNTESFIY